MKRSLILSNVMFCAAMLFVPCRGQAQDNPSPSSTVSSTVEPPLVILHAASVDRLRDRLEAVFSTAGRDEMTGKVDGWVKTTLRDLKGLDRSRPLGVMFYLKPGLGGFANIGYFPVENVEDLLATFSSESGTYQKVEGKADRYRYSNEFDQKFLALHRNGYLLVTSEDNETELDRNFPAPEKMVSKLNSRYDLAASLLIKSVPPATRQIFVTFLQTQTMAELQRKDDEPEGAYRVRKANGENLLELIEKIVTQGEELTLGTRLDEKTGFGEIDLEVAGTPDSKLAKFFQGMTGRKSLFANLLQQPSMMTLAVSWQLDEKQRKAITELFSVAPEEIDRQVAGEGVEGAKSALAPIFETLLNSAQSGHMDGFLQIAGDGPGAYTFLGGARVAGGTNFPKQLQEVLEYTKDKFGHNDRVAALELDVERINGFPVHRVPLSPADKPGQWMFGEGSQLFAYATTQALWIAFGGDQALETLKQKVAEAGKPATQAEDRRQRVPFLFQTHAKQWVTVQNESGAYVPRPNPNRRRLDLMIREEMQTVFDEQNDGVRVEVRPTDSGVRVRFEFQKGWVGLFGRVVAGQIDRASAVLQPQTPADDAGNTN